MLGPPHLLATLLGMALLCAGCDSDPTPKVDPTPTFTTPPVTTTPPTTPTVTSDPVVDTPKMVVKRWIELYNVLLTDGAPEHLMAPAPGCASCTKLFNAIAEAYANGGYVHGGTWHLLRLQPHGRNAGLVGWIAHVDSDPSEFKDSASGLIRKFTGGPLAMEFDLKRLGGAWVVDYMVQVTQ